jgi:hypothetical protein
MDLAQWPLPSSAGRSRRPHVAYMRCARDKMATRGCAEKTLLILCARKEQAELAHTEGGATGIMADPPHR